MPEKRSRSKDGSEPNTRDKRPCFETDEAEEPTELRPDTGTHEPLTTANLQRLQRHLAPPMADGQVSPGKKSRKTSPTKSGLSRTTATTSNVPVRLDSFNIFIYGEKSMPADLKKLFDNMSKPHPGLHSPNARVVVERQRAAEMKGEASGIDLLRRPLLGQNAFETGKEETRAQGLDHIPNANLFRMYLPPLRNDVPGSILKSPQPDSTFGYLLTEIASRCKMESVFSQADERMLRFAQVCKEVHFPFLTCQWKSTLNKGTHIEAQQQGARDGATIVNATYQFLKNARPDQEEPSTAETCHFSATCDMKSIYLYLHWRCVDGDEVTYEMDRIGEWFMNDEANLRKVRDTIKNITHWAKTERLDMLKTAIPGYTNFVVGKSTNSQLLTPPIDTSPLGSPLQEPLKKRKLSQVSELISGAVVEGSISSLQSSGET